MESGNLHEYPALLLTKFLLFLPFQVKNVLKIEKEGGREVEREREV